MFDYNNNRCCRNNYDSVYENNCENRCENNCENRRCNNGSYCGCNCRVEHVHEVVSHVQEGGCCCRHRHNVNAVTGTPIWNGNDHVHPITFETDCRQCHNHDYCGVTCGAIYIGGGRHVHRIEGKTTCVEGHDHAFCMTSHQEEAAGCMTCGL